MDLIIILKSYRSFVLLGSLVFACDFRSSSSELSLESRFLVLGHVLFQKTARVCDLSLLVDVVLSYFVSQDTLIVLNHFPNHFQMEHISVNFRTKIRW